MVNNACPCASTSADGFPVWCKSRCWGSCRRCGACCRCRRRAALAPPPAPGTPAWARRAAAPARLVPAADSGVSGWEETAADADPGRQRLSGLHCCRPLLPVHTLFGMCEGVQ